MRVRVALLAIAALLSCGEPPPSVEWCSGWCERLQECSEGDDFQSACLLSDGGECTTEQAARECVASCAELLDADSEDATGFRHEVKCVAESTTCGQAEACGKED